MTYKPFRELEKQFGIQIILEERVYDEWGYNNYNLYRIITPDGYLWREHLKGFDVAKECLDHVKELKKLKKNVRRY